MAETTPNPYAKPPSVRPDEKVRLQPYGVKNMQPRPKVPMQAPPVAGLPPAAPAPVFQPQPVGPTIPVAPPAPPAQGSWGTPPQSSLVTEPWRNPQNIAQQVGQTVRQLVQNSPVFRRTV